MLYAITLTELDKVVKPALWDERQSFAPWHLSFI